MSPTGSNPTPLGGVDVIVLAGGLGTRLRSVVSDRPKILAPVDGTPFLDLLLAKLAALGAARAILSLGYRAEMVDDHIRTRPVPLPVVTVVEPEPLGTAGGLRLAAPLAATDPVIVMNGDTWVEADYGAFLASHHRMAAPCSILCARVEDASAFGRIEIGADGLVTRFVEKDAALKGPATVSAGIHVISRLGMADLLKSTGPSLERDFFAHYAPGRVHGFVDPSAYFIDIGTPAGLALAATHLGRRPGPR
jgi:mannose-1-phosphate guanylyltransferase